ncbi:MAG: hypothetical protein ACFKPT_27360 [Gloeotrichia echinulata GP01]
MSFYYQYFHPSKKIQLRNFPGTDVWTNRNDAMNRDKSITALYKRLHIAGFCVGMHDVLQKLA